MKLSNPILIALLSNQIKFCLFVQQTRIVVDLPDPRSRVDLANRGVRREIGPDTHRATLAWYLPSSSISAHQLRRLMRTVSQRTRQHFENLRAQLPGCLCRPGSANKPIRTAYVLTANRMDRWHIFMVPQRADCQLGSPNGRQSDGLRPDWI